MIYRTRLSTISHATINGTRTEKETSCVLLEPCEGKPSSTVLRGGRGGNIPSLPDLRAGQDWKQEIVAELSAAALCAIVGKTSRTLGNSYQYISRYAEEANLTPVQACLKVIKDVEGVLNLILNGATQKGGNSHGNIIREV